MFDTIVPLFPGIPGGPELLVVLLFAVLLFSANRIPKLARSSGEALGEFNKGREEVESELAEVREGGEGADADTETEPRAREVEAESSCTAKTSLLQVDHPTERTLSRS
jgi:sec-independent protein translocase protein TatA